MTTKPTAPCLFLDESAARVDPIQMAHDGFTLLMRYINPDSGGFNSSKLVRAPEMQYDYDRGTAIALVYQNTGADGLGGAAAGHAHGKIAAQCLAVLPWHGKRLLVAALDTKEAAPNELHVVDEFMDAFQLEVPQVIVDPYAPYSYVEHWGQRMGRGRTCWQSAAMAGNGAGSGGVSRDGRRLSQFAAAYQRVQQLYGGAVDVNDLFIDPAEFGFYHPDWEDDMAITADDITNIARAATGELLERISVDDQGTPKYPDGNKFQAAVIAAVGKVLPSAVSDQAGKDAVARAVADELAKRLAG